MVVARGLYCRADVPGFAAPRVPFPFALPLVWLGGSCSRAVTIQRNNLRHTTDGASRGATAPG